MKSLWTDLYLSSPFWVQNLSLSLYGYVAEKTRRGGDYLKYRNEIETHLSFNEYDLRNYINHNLRTLVINAASNVPYYQRLFEAQGVNALDIETVDDLEKIPLLNKEELRKNPDFFIDSNYPKKNLLLIHTTGTTGTPLKIFCDKKTRQLNYAFYDRYLAGVEIDVAGKRATFGGRIIVPPEQNYPPFWRYSHFQNSLLFSSYHLSDNNIPKYITKLADFRPDFIDSYPSCLYVIARYSKEHNIDLRNITRGITTSAETLFPEQRNMIESTFGVPIFDQYGAAEMCVFAAQCREGSYHMHLDYGIVEFLREDGKRAKAGEEAELVCTGFINSVMPLIRYRIGDRGILSGTPCKCGSVFPVIEKLIGRMDDCLLTPDGRRVGRLSPVLKGFPVKEVQYVQKDQGSLQVLIVRGEGFSAGTESQILGELRKRLGDKIMIEFKYVENISRGKGAKLRSVISNVRID